MFLLLHEGTPQTLELRPPTPKAYFALQTSQRKRSSLFVSQNYTSPLFVYHKLNFPSAVETGIKRSPNKSTEHSLQFPLEVRPAISTPLPPSPLLDPNYAFSTNQTLRSLALVCANANQTLRSLRLFIFAVFLLLNTRTPQTLELRPPTPKAYFALQTSQRKRHRYLYHKITLRPYLFTTSLTFLPPLQLE